MPHTLEERSGRPLRLLVVTSDPADAEFLGSLLGRAKLLPGCHLIHAPSLEDGLEVLRGDQADLILLDLDIGSPSSEGPNLLEELYRAGPGIPIVVLAENSREQEAIRALQKGAQDYLLRDTLDTGRLARTIRYAVETRRIKSDLALLTRDLQETKGQLERLSLVDPLTELLNRRGLQKVLFHEIHRVRRDGSPLSAILVDLDEFKQVNATLGHAVGDLILREVTSRIQHALRGMDYISRVGGDEFLLLLPQTRPTEALRVAERLRLALSRSPVSVCEGEAITVTASIGVVAVPETLYSVDELVAHTQLILIQTQTEGHNRVRLEGGTPLPKSSRDRALRKLLQAIQDGGGFHVVRQPILDLVEMKEVATELLTRSSIKGFETPNRFFPLSMDANLLTAVDRECLNRCIAASENVDPATLCHLNLFPSTMLNLRADELLGAFAHCKSDRRFCVEISERQLIGPPSNLAGVVDMLKGAGIQIAVDDVGFGNSCLESLVVLEPDIVKIDRKCVTGLKPHGPRARSLKRLLDVARVLGMEVVAEGIETEEELAVVRQMGVRLGQGYLLGRPE